VARTGRPKKQNAYGVMLRVRILPEQDELIRKAAEITRRHKGSGDVSKWVRDTLEAAARRVVAKEGGVVTDAPQKPD
jgi:uncharacterized protein (DUF1778 family)